MYYGEPYYLPKYVTILSFTCFSLKELGVLSLPESVKTLGDGCFCRSSGKEIRCSDNMLSLGANLFLNASIDRFVFPKNANYISPHIFSDLYHYTEFYVPKSLYDSHTDLFEHFEHGYHNVNIKII